VNKQTKSNILTDNDVTDEQLFNQRRHFIKSGMVPQLAFSSISKSLDSKFSNLKKSGFTVDAKPHSFDDISSYNNFYELGYSKGAPKKNASALITDPWSVEIAGECAKPGVYTLEDILKPHDFEERIYRFRCVEAWSMVIPWVGFSLADLIKRFEPNSKAKYVAC